MLITEGEIRLAMACRYWPIELEHRVLRPASGHNLLELHVFSWVLVELAKCNVNANALHAGRCTYDTFPVNQSRAYCLTSNVPLFFFFFL